MAVAGACAFVAFCGPAPAEDSLPPAQSARLKKMSLEDLMEIKVQTVYAASKHEEAVTAAPASVSIVTEEDIQDFGYRTLGDLLNSVRGFYVDFDRGYSVAGLRGVNRPGSYGDGILLMVNGHRLNDALVGAAYTYDDFPLDVDLIDRVEVIRGPGSALYGDNAFFSVINVITRRGRDVQGGELSSSAGAFGAYSGRLSYGWLFTNGLEVLVSATDLDDAGHRHLYFPEFQSVNGGFADGLDGERAARIFVSATYQEFTLEGAFNQRKKALPTAAYGALFDVNPNDVLDQREYAELRWKHETEAGWTLQARAAYDGYHYAADGPFDAGALGLGAPGEIALGHERDATESAGGELQASRTFWERHQVLFGLEGRDDAAISGKYYFDSPPLTVQDQHGDKHNLGIYAQDEYAILTNLSLDLGGRFDYYSTVGETANPRGGILYSPWPGTTFKLLAGQAYRAPNVSEFAYNAPGYVPNYSLKAETVRSYEWDWEQQLARPLRLTAGVFRNDIRNEITQVDETANPAVGGITFLNTGKAKVEGAEVELEGRWEGGWRGRVSYTYADGRDVATGAWLSDSPRHMAKMDLAVPLYREKVLAGLELQAMSERLSTDRTATTPGFVIANFTLLTRELAKGLEVSASVYNVFDRHYANPVGRDFPEEFVAQDGRSFRVKLTFRF
jgi:iron complex outermembrane receptor protein